ncbi:peptidoglycan DD-metalloendopeptidase family protein [Tenacibaculum agarivorans]|uniref:peptidoglycan DD-metalloendopeptidase family protein n=1 Tax=Tenacibaculum agarivorans TaxID=1908389 RepID=UPI00094BAACE|nr:peptidoglycan DD-metalloendopeptidase family protein [Tenacibaculum agarivorans]
MLLYLIQVTVVFGLLYLFYVLFLKSHTFYGINRAILLTIIPLSICLPLSNTLLPQLSQVIVEVPILEEVNSYSFEQNTTVQQVKQKFTDINYHQFLLVIYVLGVIISISKFFFSVLELIRLQKNTAKKQGNGYHLVFIDTKEIFSFINWIFIPKKMKHNDLIVAHEKAHIRLKHSYDILFYEIYFSFFWFNPLSYFYRKSIKSIHEFQADKAVLTSNVKPSMYLKLLMDTIDNQKTNNAYNYFNNPILKQRIVMITKQKSNQLHKIKYFLLLPLCLILVSAFTTPIEEIPFNIPIGMKRTYNTPPSLFPLQNTSAENITAYFGQKGRHPKVNKGVIHTGIDIKAKIGTPVIATENGVIAKASSEGVWGNLIIIIHDNGYETWYAHLDSFKVTQNTKVKKGEVIGYVGNTGRSTGPHLHYEVKQNGKHLDPLDFIE